MEPGGTSSARSGELTSAATILALTHQHPGELAIGVVFVLPAAVP
jgi:hypothetical protein